MTTTCVYQVTRRSIAALSDSVSILRSLEISLRTNEIKFDLSIIPSGNELVTVYFIWLAGGCIASLVKKTKV